MMLVMAMILASITAHQSSQTQFEGRWVALGPTRAITGMTISQVAGELVVDAAGACTPVDCQWSRQRLSLFRPVDGNAFNRAVAVWNTEWQTTYATLTADDGALVVELYRVYTDNSGRSNVYASTRLIRQ